MNKRNLGFLTMVLCFGAISQASAATILDLGHPTKTPFVAIDIGNLDRSSVFDALTNFTIESAGIKMNPFDVGGATSLSVSIYAVTDAGDPAANNGTGNRGGLLASASTNITDIGLVFYDIPISYSFLSGNRYDLAFDTPGGFGQLPTAKNQMEFYTWDPSQPDYATFDVAATVKMIDGGFGGNYRNDNFPHTQITLSGNEQVIPEPSTYLSLGAGLILLGYLRIRK